MLLLLSFVIGVLCILFFNWFPKHQRRWKCYNLIPGPKPMFLIGNALELPGRKEIIPKFMQWRQQFGNIIRIHAGPKVMYIVMCPKLAETILTSQTLIKKGHMYKFVMPWLGNGLLTSTGEKWKSRRKIITPTFHFKILEQFIDVFHSNTEIFIQEIEKEVGKNSFNVYPYVTNCTLDVICETAMGIKMNAQTCPDSDYVKCVKTMLQIVIERTFSIGKQFDFIFKTTSFYKEQQRVLKILHGFTDSVIKARREELLKSKELKREDVGEEDDNYIKKKMAFLDLLLQATENGQPLSDLDIREEVDTFMFEGHDTTASALSFALYSIANNPQVQTKILEEQNLMFGEDMVRRATYGELQEMKYLEMVIKESLRKHPSAALIARQITEDVKFEDYTFLEGGVFTLFLYGLLNNPEIFPNPEKFDPERFSPNNSSQRNVFSYVPFSAGARNCIGQKFAMLEMKSFLSNALRRYEFLSAVPKNDPQLVVEGILNSDNGIHVRIKDRVR